MVGYMKKEIRLAQITGETSELFEKLGKIPEIADKIANGGNVFQEEMVPEFHKFLKELDEEKEKGSTLNK